MLCQHLGGRFPASKNEPTRLTVSCIKVGANANLLFMGVALGKVSSCANYSIGGKAASMDLRTLPHLWINQMGWFDALQHLDDLQNGRFHHLVLAQIGARSDVGANHHVRAQQQRVI